MAIAYTHIPKTSKQINKRDIEVKNMKPLVHVDISLLAANVGKSPTNTFD